MSSFILYSRYHFLHEFQAILEILIAAHKIISNFLSTLTLMKPTFTLVGYKMTPIWHGNCLLGSCVEAISNKAGVEIAGGNMKKYVGLWLDHREAFVVYLLNNQPFTDGNQETIERIESDIERRVRLSGGSRSPKTPYGPQEISVDGKQEDRIKGQLRKYYQEIIKRISDADRILILGPGEAKTELKKEIGKSKQLAVKIKKIETADKMTIRQIAAKVREYFKPHL